MSRKNRNYYSEVAAIPHIRHSTFSTLISRGSIGRSELMTIATPFEEMNIQQPTLNIQWTNEQMNIHHQG